MKLIRKSVFETNSSSCHSISVNDSDVYDSVTPNSDNLIVIPIMEFGWEENTYDDSMDKMAYVWIYIRDWANAVSKVPFMDMFKKVVCDHTGAADVYMDPGVKSSWGSDEGYIDHQSVEDGDLNHLFDSEAKLKSFLFSNKSEIITDNDNH